MSMNVQPDRELIKIIKEAGGDTLKQCYQCATCSVACPLSTEGSPFPRKEMIYAQWGLKDKLMGDPDVFLCHHCGDCTVMCPRGARPSEVLSAIRAYVYTNLGWPQSLAQMCTSIKNLPMLVGIPALVVFVMWLISGGMQLPSGEHFAKVGYQQFFGHWDFHLLSKNVLFIDIIMLTAVGIAVYSLYKGVSVLWKSMSASLNQGEVGYRPGIVQFVKEFLWPSLVEIVQHKRFEECKENHSRVRGHRPLMLAFIGLFIVTIYSMVKNDVFGIFFPSLHGPISMWNPVKWLANVAAVAMIFGIVVLWQNRKKMEADGMARNTFYDWFYIWIIAAVGVTGLAAELLRIISLPSLGYIIYYVHLVSVVMLFLYLPYSKFAHIVYRTVAYAFDRYRQSAYVKNPLNE